jgi:uncharacterized membrane protein YvbJ
MELFSCPECGYENPKGSVSCKRCLLIFEKYERKNQKVNAQMVGSRRLEEQWREILSDYESLEKHEKFISDALREKNLPYASQQYRKMLDMNPVDEIAKKMIDKIINVTMLTYTPPIRKEPPKNNRWITVLILLAIIFLVAIVVFMGIMSTRAPNV